MFLLFWCEGFLSWWCVHWWLVSLQTACCCKSSCVILIWSLVCWCSPITIFDDEDGVLQAEGFSFSMAIEEYICVRTQFKFCYIRPQNRPESLFRWELVKVERKSSEVCVCGTSSCRVCWTVWSKVQQSPNSHGYLWWWFFDFFDCLIILLVPVRVSLLRRHWNSNRFSFDLIAFLTCEQSQCACPLRAPLSLSWLYAN